MGIPINDPLFGAQQKSRTMDEPKDKITLSLGEILCHNGTRCKFKLTRTKIRIGCTEVEPEAAKFIIEKYNQYFPPVETEKEVTIQ